MTYVETLRRESTDATVFALLAATDADRLTRAMQIAQVVQLPPSGAIQWSALMAFPQK
jgi:hypothetical protein